MIVRRAAVSEIETVMDLAESAPTSSHWLRGVYEAICTKEPTVEDAVARVILVACAENAQFPSEIVGFAAFSAVFAAGGEEEYELENMVVADAWRRRGVGRRLVAVGGLWCRTWRSAPEPHGAPDFRPGGGKQPSPSFWLEVRASNRSAIAFYESVGFQVTDRRTNYYAHPPEDAVRMRALALR